uniref:trypsin n=1 Tax=Amphiprion ocellaris TaxID=80972 RepID=A0AAQ5Z3L6_AMPOC
MFPVFAVKAFKNCSVSAFGFSSNGIMVSEKEALLAAFIAALVAQSAAIIGGREAAPHSRPYMASIQVPEGENLKHECGGFVIADQWVMTAVHCMPNGANGRKVVLGVHSLSEPEETKQTFDILELHNHPDFSVVNYDNDIALIKLDHPFNASDAVKAVEFLRAGGTNPDTDAEVVNSARCRRSDYFGRKFTSNMICAHKVCPDPCDQPHKKEDSCDGDSGGPLLYNGVAVGITSNGGKKCGQLRKPGIYTIISRYTEWIDKTMNLQPTGAPDQPADQRS